MKVQDLLSSEEKWSKGSLAVDEFGNGVAYNSKEAASFCLEGAILKCYRGKMKRTEIIHTMANLIDVRTYGKYKAIAYWNDAPERTFKQIRKLIEGMDI